MIFETFNYFPVFIFNQFLFPSTVLRHKEKSNERKTIQFDIYLFHYRKKYQAKDYYITNVVLGGCCCSC